MVNGFVYGKFKIPWNTYTKASWVLLMMIYFLILEYEKTIPSSILRSSLPCRYAYTYVYSLGSITWFYGNSRLFHKKINIFLIKIHMLKYILAILLIATSLIPTQTEAFSAPSRIERCERLYLPGMVYNRLIMTQCDLIWRYLTWQQIQSLGDYGNF